MRRRFMLLVVVAAMGAFGGSVGCSGGSSKPGQTNATGQAVTRSQSLWKSRAVSDYDFTFINTGFVASDSAGPVRIQVRKGVAVSVKPVRADQTIKPESFDAYNTVDKLFDVLRASSSRNPAQQQQKFNAAYGYPESAYIDYDAKIADEELAFTVSDFTPVTAAK